MRFRRQIGFGLVAAVVAAALVGYVSGVIRDRRAGRDLVEARRLMEAERFDVAHRLLIRIPAGREADAEVAYRLGVCEHALGDPRTALKRWEQVGPKNPWTLPAALAAAQTFVGDLGRLADAEEALERALPGAEADGVELRHTLSQIYFLQGRRDDMRRLIEQGWRWAPDPVAELHDHWRTDNATPLVEYIRQEIEHAAIQAPDDDRIWLARAFLAIQGGKLDDAAIWLDRCARRRPDDAAVWRARLDLARQSDDLPGAEEALRHLGAADFPADERLAWQAWLASRRGDADAERRALETLVDRWPGRTRELDRLAELEWADGRPERVAELRARKADADRLKERYLRMLEDRAIEPDAFAELGRLAGSLGRTFEAEGWWTLAIRQADNTEEARKALARLRERPAEPPSPSGTTLAQALGVAESSAARQAGRIHEGLPPVTGPKSGPIVPSFRDDAESTGLRFVLNNGRSYHHQMPETTCGGVALLDFDGDGWMDVFAVQGGEFPPDPERAGGDRLFRNRGDGTFDDVTESSGIAGLVRGYGHGVTVGDFDNDGHPDLFLTRWRAYQLLRNRGDGTFEDATEAAGLGGDRDWPTSAAFADLDNDGDLDLYVAHYLAWDSDNPMLCRRKPKPNEADLPERHYDYCMPHPFPALPDHLFRNDGGRFVDVTAEAGIVDPDGRGLGVVAADADGDGLLDLFVANDTTANYLWHNLGGMKFEEIGFASGVACNAGGTFQAGMGTAFGDLDGDGLPDLLVTNFYGESTSFFRNLGGGMFADQTNGIGLAVPSRFLLGFGLVLFDANNDGRLDLATANGHVVDDRPDFPWEMPALLVIGGGPGGKLIDVSRQAGDPWQVVRMGRALASCDLDNDGRPDLLLAGQNEPLAYFHNQTRDTGRFVTLQLEGAGPGSNRDAIGASVTIEAGGKTFRGWRTGGGSFQSASDPRLHLGLGGAERVDRVEVRWPSGKVETYPGIEPGRGYRICEGDPEVKRLPGFGGTSGLGP
ncbi:MAG: FG-GAP-like repeat-containing protein [Isosphaeraceae bacterium]